MISLPTKLLWPKSLTTKSATLATIDTYVVSAALTPLAISSLSLTDMAKRTCKWLR